MRATRRSAIVPATMMLAATVAAAQTPFTVGSLTAAPGTRASGDLIVPARGGDAGTVVPITIVHGAKAGPVLALVAGVHGAEYPPILAMQRLRTGIDPTDLAGTIIMVHVANMPAFLGRATYYTPGDRQNLNRVFPGRADGTISERIAEVITREVIDRAQYLIDMHCGDANESLRPYLYWTVSASAEFTERVHQLALAFGLDHIVIDRARPTDPAASVYLENTAITRGKPAVTIESGAMGQSDEESIARIERGVAGVLKHLKMRTGGPGPVDRPVYLGRSQVITSGHTGIFYPAVERGHTVAEGALIGRITDFFGRTLQDVRAPFAGEVLYVVGSPPMTRGEPVAFIAAVATAADFPARK